jgi:hypothetical protein
VRAAIAILVNRAIFVYLGKIFISNFLITIMYGFGDRSVMNSELGLTLTNIFLGVMFLISEVLGASKCQANGVVAFMIHGLACFGGKSVRVRFESVREPVVVVV